MQFLVIAPRRRETLSLAVWSVSRRVNRAGNENNPKLIEGIH
jgi:hypothetical protein